MSLSYPDREQVNLKSAAWAAWASVTLLAVITGSAQAAETSFQPAIEARAEQNTNRNLAAVSENELDVHGYVLTAEGLWRYATPVNETRIQPRVRFQQYPDEKSEEQTEIFLDLSTRHSFSERNALDLVGRYARQDAFNAELGDAGFDDFDPNDPTDPSGESAVLGEDRRTRVQLRPGFSHVLSELTELRLAGVYETIRYDSDRQDRTTDYDWMALEASVIRRLDPRTQISFGPTASLYETRSDFNRTESYGGFLGWDRELTALSSSGFRAFAERSGVEVTDATGWSKESETNYGAEFNARKRTETGRIWFRAGRTLVPTSRGSISLRDEMRLQYDHDFSERWSMKTAVRAYRRDDRGLSTNDRDYARGELRLSYRITPTVFFATGLEYTWEDRDDRPSSADNQTYYLSIGYRGLGRPR